MKHFILAISILLFFGFTKHGNAQTPTANFVANPVTGCAPMVVQFTSTSTGNPTLYNWNLGNGVNSNLQNPSTTYTAPGYYSVTLTVSNANGSNTKTITNMINVLPGPTVAFSGSPTAGCPPLTVAFTNTSSSNTSGGLTYQWIFGDGSPFSTQKNPTHIYSSPNLCNVVLKVTDASNCVTTLTKANYINIYTPPVANFNAPSQCNVPAVVTFTSTSTGTAPLTYQWDFGDGGTGSGANPTHTYNTANTYTIKLIVTDANGCSDTAIGTNYLSVGALLPNFTFSSACPGAPMQFTNTSNIADSVLWYFGDGTSDTAYNPSHIYVASGSYNVKLIVYRSSCKDSMLKTITVNPKPTASFSFNPPNPCPAPSTVLFTNTTTGGSTYLWSFGDGGTSTSTNATHTYSTNDTFQTKLVAMNTFGCKDTVSQKITVRDIIFTFTVTPRNYGCIPLTVKFKNELKTHVTPTFGFLYPPPYYPYPFSTVSYLWDFGDGTTSTLDTPTHVYTTQGIFLVQLTVTTSNGCTVYDTLHIQAGFKPTANFTWTPSIICISDSIHLTNLSTGATGYNWYFSDGTGGIAKPNPSYKFKNSGKMGVTLVAGNFGCTDTMIKDSIITVYPSASKPVVNYRCDSPLAVYFIDSSIQVSSRLWLFGDGATDTSAQPSHTYSAYGFYNVRLIVYNNVYGCIDTSVYPIDLFSPTLSFSTPDTAICLSDSIVFTPVFTQYPEDGYNWWVSDSLLWPYTNPAADPNNPSHGKWGHRFNKKGIFAVSVSTKDNHGCPHYAIRNPYILVAKPKAGYVASPIPACKPAMVLFRDTSSNTPGAYQVLRNWSFGNGIQTTPFDTIWRSYPLGGLYNTNLIVTDNIGCSDTLAKAKYIDIREVHISFAANDSNGCINQWFQFNSQAFGNSKLTFKWNFGDGTTDTARNPLKRYTQTGNYTVKLVATDTTGCADSITKIGYIKISKPVAGFQVSDSLAICPPLNVVISNTSIGALTYAWDLGNGSFSNLPNPTSSYFTPGVYTIKLIAANAQNCKDTAYQKVRLLGYSGALQYAPLSGCIPLTVKFKAQLFNVPSVVWDFSDGVTLPANGIDSTVHTYTIPGAFVPKLIMADNTGCKASSDGVDTIKADAVHAGFTTSPTCINTPIILTDTSFSYFSAVTKWYWNFGNGTPVSIQNPTTTRYTSFGTYTIKLTTTNANGCVDSTNMKITILPLPSIVTSADTSICQGDAAQLSASGGQTFVWSPASTLSCSLCSSPTAKPSVNTKYVVVGTDVYGCANRDSVLVSIKFKTTSEIGNGGNICIDSMFQLMGKGAQRYEWTPTESLNNSRIYNPIATPSVTTTYTMIAWEGSCLPDTHTVKVVVFPKPIVDAGQDITIISGQSTILSAKGSNFESLIWSPASTLSCEVCSNPSASPRTTTQYRVVAVSMYGCKTSDTVTVHVLCDKSQLFIPNSFTPNGDGENDIFYPRGEGLRNIRSFCVYNRWGEKIFERTDILLNDKSAGWDGTYKGVVLSPDVFVYVIDGICEDGSTLTWKGDISLIR
ncbi:MAG: PKD domain-containing protein [Bacteroidetes bacterium]|nr:PKD domain-containing protein [Bacteroidota bacterium]